MHLTCHYRAAPTTALTHITIQEAVRGTNVEWLEKDSDAE